MLIVIYDLGLIVCYDYCLLFLNDGKLISDGYDILEREGVY